MKINFGSWKCTTDAQNMKKVINGFQCKRRSAKYRIYN